MSDLANILRKRITREGPITVADYMTAALGHPRYGYYMTRDPFGRAGDFITAPEISQMFGELIGLWAVAVWQGLGQPESLRLIELGPGRGTLLADALRAIRQAEPACFEALDVALVETSPALRARQNETLRPWQERRQIAWHDSVGAVADGSCIVIANEFFDALPIRQYERRGRDWCERLIGVDEDGRFRFVPSEPLADASVIPTRFQDAPAGSILEARPAGEVLVKDICRRLSTHGGACLMIDYGHTVRSVGDTLQAVKGQKYHGIFDTPGAADVTAHVDFQALADAADTPGTRVFGPVTQRAFLERLGIRHRADRLMARAASDQRAALQAALERLIGEDEMGTLFKVLAVAESRSAPLPGFD
jgi:NADH dehydrogenase [ubiquinone] 1 alpha subcomplex assembly factor 7